MNMTWSYHIVGEQTSSGEWDFTVREVYLEKDGEGQVLWTEKEVSPSGQNLHEFTKSFSDYIVDVASNPVLFVYKDGSREFKPMLELLEEAEELHKQNDQTEED